jgi:tetratricopeptide (TPR) repeat protein
MQEAVITARLEHPNIVPVHDVTQEDGGLPMLVMKLVRGKPWDTLIHEDFKLPVPVFLRRHLAILEDVAQAISFAHSREVIHRDLKPSQVMVGEFGEVQLMDWGIAVHMEEVRRSLDPGASGGLVQNPSGTSAYMAPEQTESNARHLGPWTDVYLLGGILYFLLTGRLPHPGQPSIVAFEQARYGIVPPPHESNPGRLIPAELARLAMTAMAPNPADRLPSAQDFVARLQAYLSGESAKEEADQILAQLEPKLASRPSDYRVLQQAIGELERARVLWPDHPQMAGTSDLLHDLFVEAALSRGDIQLARTHADLLSAPGIREPQRARVREAEQLAEQAEDRLRQAREDSQNLLDFVVIDLHSSLKDLGRLDLLEKASLRVFAHFDRFAALPDDTSRRSRTHALRNIADVFKEKGLLTEAMEAATKAIRMAETECDRSPKHLDWKDDLADCWDRAGIIAYELGDLKLASRDNLRGMEIRQKLVEADTCRNDWRSKLAWSHNRQGLICWRQGDQQTALGHFNSAVSHRRLILEDEEQGDVNELAALGFAYNGRLWVHRALGDAEAAFKDADLALKIRREVSRERPQSLLALGDLAWSLKSSAIIHEDRMNLSTAEAAFEEALAIGKRLTDADPANTTRRMEVAFCHGGLAKLYHLVGRMEEAEASFKAAIELHATVTEQPNCNGYDLRDYLFNVAGLTAVLLALHREKEAQRVAMRATRWGEEIIRRAPNNPSFVEARARLLLQLGRASEAIGDRSLAGYLWNDAVNSLEGALNRGDHSPAVEETLAVGLYLLGQRQKADDWMGRMLAKGWARWNCLESMLGFDPRRVLREDH